MLTATRARHLFDYDPASGLLTRRVSRGGERAGTVVKALQGDGYCTVTIDRKHYLVHRVIWLMHYGRWPVGDVDHRDRDRANNRIGNLREATRSQNNANARVRLNNACKLKGVSPAHKSYKYQARIRVCGKQIYLGLFDTAEAAHAAYVAAARQHFGDFARVE